MRRYIGRIGPILWLISGLAIWFTTFAGVRANAPASVAVAESPAVALNRPQTPQPGGWSPEDCAICHAAAAGPAFQHTAHARQTQGCATCHQKVAEHVKAKKAGETGGPTPTLKKLTARELNAICLTCHEKNNQQNFIGSTHDRRNVACTSCHSVHSYESTKAQLKTAQDTETCYSCHPAVRAKQMRTSHHPLREGKLSCASCHNPHDGSRPKMLKADSVNELCYTCHTEKRGPFLYEHGPVREDCATCHDPHGSNQDRMLVAKPPFLCQRCHYSGHGITGDNNNTLKGPPVAAGNPPGVTVTQTTRSARQMERSCPNCHLALHGSNSASGWAFVR